MFTETSQAAKSLGCFTGNTTVTLADGHLKRMSQLEIGDRVLTMNSEGKLEYSQVMMFMHYSPNQLSQFLRITTTSGINITITPSHLILRWQKPNVSSLYEAKPVYARDVKVSEQLLIHGHTADRPLYVDEIARIEVVYETGVYAPLTETGTIVVNDIVASCYAIIYSQRLAHLAFAPIRVFNTMETSFSRFYYLITKPFISKNTNSTVVARYAPQQGIHWYCKLLRGISNFIIPSSWFLEM